MIIEFTNPLPERVAVDLVTAGSVVRHSNTFYFVPYSVVYETGNHRVYALAVAGKGSITNPSTLVEVVDAVLQVNS
jgi:hypothetical protein